MIEGWADGDGVPVTLASSPASHRLVSLKKKRSTITEGAGGNAMEKIRVCTRPASTCSIARNKYRWLEMQAVYPFSEKGIGKAVADAMAMKTVKSTIVPWPEPVE